MEQVNLEIDTFKKQIKELENRLSALEKIMLKTNSYYTKTRCNKCASFDSDCECDICFGCGKAICECD
jgi:hypothetical protein